MPLDEFPLEMRLAILDAVAQPKPPPKWLDIGEMGNGRPMAQIPSRAWMEWYRARGIDPEKRRDPLPKWLRRAVIERDGLMCQLCGDPVAEDDVHIDHRYPRSRGGSDSLENLQVTHSACNLAKGTTI
jgi:hypothetical protein